MGTRLVQWFWILVAFGLVLLVLCRFGVPLPEAAMVTGVLAGLCCLVVLIRPFRRADWEDFWERLADWLPWL